MRITVEVVDLLERSTNASFEHCAHLVTPIFAVITQVMLAEGDLSLAQLYALTSSLVQLAAMAFATSFP